MVDIDEQTDEQIVGQENEQRRKWKIVQDLEVQLQLGVVVTHRSVTERLPRPTSLETWKSWLIHESLTRIWQGVQKADASLLLSVATILMAVSKLDEYGIACSSRQPAFPLPFIGGQPITPPADATKIAQAKGTQGWSIILAARSQCSLSDEILQARQAEEGVSLPTTLGEWQAWFIREAVPNIVTAAQNHDNPLVGGGSAWLFRASALEIAASARLYELGVRPLAPISIPPLLAEGVYP